MAVGRIRVVGCASLWATLSLSLSSWIHGRCTAATRLFGAREELTAGDHSWTDEFSRVTVRRSITPRAADRFRAHALPGTLAPPRRGAWIALLGLFVLRLPDWAADGRLPVGPWIDALLENAYVLAYVLLLVFLPLRTSSRDPYPAVESSAPA